MMKMRLLSMFMLAVFAWTIGGPALAAAIEPEDEVLSSSNNHSDGIPCPDGDEEGPCDGGCPCVCCPGHATTLSSPSAVFLESPHLSTAHRFGSPDVNHRSGSILRIFRPPRV